MATIYRYQPVVTTGPNGNSIAHRNTEDNEITELATVDGMVYISVPDGVVLPEQPTELTMEQVVPAAGMVQAMAAASRMTSHFERFVEQFLDAGAKSRGYRDIISACSYTGAENPFQAESQSFVVWRGQVWALCYQILNAVMAGERDVPTVESLLAELPAHP